MKKIIICAIIMVLCAFSALAQEAFVKQRIGISFWGVSDKTFSIEYGFGNKRLFDVYAALGMGSGEYYAVPFINFNVDAVLASFNLIKLYAGAFGGFESYSFYYYKHLNSKSFCYGPSLGAAVFLGNAFCLRAGLVYSFKDKKNPYVNTDFATKLSLICYF